MTTRMVLYRKWRPKLFAEIVGQPILTRTLRQAVIHRRIAHAYLFCGPRGTGKTSTARILAKAQNCKGIDRSGKMPDWMKSGRKKLGVKGQLKIARTVYNAWGLKGLLTIFESERIFSSKHTGYGIIVG